MTPKNSPLKCTSIDLEIEAIQRFRKLAPFLKAECRVYRELNGRSTVLCLDFKTCPQELKTNKEEWHEFAQLLLHSSHYLGLANSLVFKHGDRILAWMSLNQTQYFGEFLAEG
ncbi:hypothetical protein IQ255_11240 [Pleurocapsales cyanobacterium LEGE 10410]|nr:hypothetical protein [Pleurocapsales cyanobacterium LEGE 10410]